jgi:hypothetical protein
MKPDESERRHAEAVEQFNRHEGRRDGERVTGSLNGGLSLLRDTVYWRVYRDLTSVVGADSMLMPVSEKKSEKLAKVEIEVYHLVESATAVREYGYIRPDDDWYLQWVTRLRLGETRTEPNVVRRLNQYRSETPDNRRLAFTDVLARTLPASRRAPLVLFRLVPLAVYIATALAFGDPARAYDLRKQQREHLGSIADCRQCRGRVLENIEQCPECGNPLWKHQWLTAAD